MVKMNKGEMMVIRYRRIGVNEAVAMKIMEFLRKHKKDKFSVLEVKKGVGIGYPATLKYVGILEARGFINVVNYGNRKEVSYKEVKV